MPPLIDGSVDIKAYEAVNAIDMFSSFEEIVAYRKWRIERYAPVALDVWGRPENIDEITKESDTPKCSITNPS